MNYNWLKLIMAAAVVMIASSAVNAQTTITVNTLADAGPGTLRDAIRDANTGDTIDFSVAGTINLNSPLPDIDVALTIDGGGQITLDGGNGEDGVFGTGDGFRIFNMSTIKVPARSPHSSLI